VYLFCFQSLVTRLWIDIKLIIDTYTILHMPSSGGAHTVMLASRNGPYNLLARILDGHGGMSENGVYGIPWYPKIGYTSSTAQGGGGSFKDRKL